MKTPSALTLILLATAACATAPKSDREQVVKAFELPVRNLRRADADQIQTAITDYLSGLTSDALPEAVGVVYATIYSTFDKDTIASAFRTLHDASEELLALGAEIGSLSPREGNLLRLTARLGLSPVKTHTRASDYVLLAGWVGLNAENAEAGATLRAEIEAGVVASDATSSSDIVAIARILGKLDGTQVSTLWPEMKQVIEKDLGLDGGRVTRATLGPVLDTVASWNPEQVASVLALVETAMAAKPEAVVLVGKTDKGTSGTPKASSARSKRAEEAIARKEAEAAMAKAIDDKAGEGLDALLVGVSEGDRVGISRLLASIQLGYPLSRPATRFELKDEAEVVYVTKAGTEVVVKPRTVPQHTTTAVQAELQEVAARHGIGNAQRLRRLGVAVLCHLLGEPQAAMLVAGEPQETNGGQAE